MDWTRVLVEILAVVGSGGLIGTLTAYLLSRRKQLHQEQMDFLPALTQRMTFLEERHQKCLEEHLKSQEVLGRLQERVKEFEERDRVTWTGPLGLIRANEMWSREQLLAWVEGHLDALEPADDWGDAQGYGLMANAGMLRRLYIGRRSIP